MFALILLEPHWNLVGGSLVFNSSAGYVPAEIQKAQLA